ncbi:hypothetical protein MKZ38_000164 [Zalerion maritima]|uniref:Uncharacterized protein n=1 Tax=Zalerion maritima TaxID=339359 RepID=A0AAD5RTE5_9PEZI|nr:hypothetical protein MKZ38_000164 [Zalerion maritima]
MASSTPSPDLKHVLILVTTGGFTHAAPLFEIARKLSSRPSKHRISLLTLQGQESWASAYPFITTIHTCGPGPTALQLESHYARNCAWKPSEGIGSIMKSKRLFDSFWPQTYSKLVELCTGREKPDLVLADFFEGDTATDIQSQFSIPVAVMWPQMPSLVGGAPYVPGKAGFLLDVSPSSISSETASIASRVRNEMVLFWGLPTLLSWVLWSNRMREKTFKALGVDVAKKMTAEVSGPKYLILVNTFWGIELPRPLPPLIQLVGPVLSEEYDPLDQATEEFLDERKKVAFVSLGTHAFLPEPRASALLRALLLALDEGVVDGVIWALNQRARDEFDLSASLHTTRISSSVSSTNSLTGKEIFSGKHKDLLIQFFSPQNAILAHPSTALFLTHGGNSSANETCFHGVKTLCMPFFFDQLSYSARLERAGMGLSLNKHVFSAHEVVEKMRTVVQDEDGYFATNVARVKKIAMIAGGRGKEVAADLVEELMVDWEGRTELEGREGREGREGKNKGTGRRSMMKLPPHLETADTRMPWWKARNLDIKGAFLLLFSEISNIASWPFLVTQRTSRSHLSFFTTSLNLRGSAELKQDSSSGFLSASPLTPLIILLKLTITMGPPNTLATEFASRPPYPSAIARPRPRPASDASRSLSLAAGPIEPLVLAISGPTSSGKTTLSFLLSSLLSTVSTRDIGASHPHIIHQDNHFHKPSCLPRRFRPVLPNDLAVVDGLLDGKDGTVEGPDTDCPAAILWDEFLQEVENALDASRRKAGGRERVGSKARAGNAERIDSSATNQDGVDGDEAPGNGHKQEQEQGQEQGQEHNRENGWPKEQEKTQKQPPEKVPPGFQLPSSNDIKHLLSPAAFSHALHVLHSGLLEIAQELSETDRTGRYVRLCQGTLASTTGGVKNDTGGRNNGGAPAPAARARLTAAPILVEGFVLFSSSFYGPAPSSATSATSAPSPPLPAPQASRARDFPRQQLALLSLATLSLFLPVARAVSRARRFSLHAYRDGPPPGPPSPPPPTASRKHGQTWRTEGYFDEVAWPNYSTLHSHLLARGPPSKGEGKEEEEEEAADDEPMEGKPPDEEAEEQLEQKKKKKKKKKEGRTQREKPAATSQENAPAAAAKEPESNSKLVARKVPFRDHEINVRPSSVATLEETVLWSVDLILLEIRKREGVWGSHPRVS